MSLHLRSINASLRVLNSAKSTHSFFPQALSGHRRCIHAVAQAQKSADPRSRSFRRDTPAHMQSEQDDLEEEDDFDSMGMAALQGGSSLGSAEIQSGGEAGRVETKDQVDVQMSEHFSGLFDPLKFPPELSRRILTHTSHPDSVRGHNRGFYFIGRRVLKAYMMLALSTSPNLSEKHDLEEICSRALNSYILGEHVGPIWGLGRMLRWTPALPTERLKAMEIREGGESLLRNTTVGLYKIQGDAVYSVMGGIFYQFGGSVAHRVFHTRLLPLLVEKTLGIPSVFHEDIKATTKHFGGPDGPLMHPKPGKIETRIVL